MLGQPGGRDIVSEPLHERQPAFNILVKFFLVVPVEREGRMYLTQSQIRMLEMEFFRTPTVCHPFENEFNDLHIGPGDDWDIRFIY